ncbi:MAG: DNA cytosine methyltransferase [Planctomycetota bacterium]
MSIFAASGFEDSRANDAVTRGSAVAAVVVDLCSGMGGLSLAARQLGMRVVAAVDTNTTALRTYAKNFPEATTVERTIAGPRATNECKAALRQRDPAAAPLVVLSGPPCQGFSAAGSRNPSDKRNKVLLAVARSIVHLAPECALVENVATLLKEKHMPRLRDFRRRLEAAGYSVLALLLDAQDFGVPQRRERAFFLITRKPINEQNVRRRLDDLKARKVPVRAALSGLPAATDRPDEYKDEQDSLAVPNHFAMRHSAKVQHKIAALQPGTGPMSYRKLHPDRPSNTLFSGHRAPPAHYEFPRSITVREAARLQGFPDSFRIYGSFANQMEQVTNAVPPPLAEAVLRVLAEQAGLGIRAHV